MYTLKIHSYENNNAIVKQYPSFKEGLIAAEGASIAIVNNWTRHPSSTEVIRHCDKYYDLFNEGSIILE